MWYLFLINSIFICLRLCHFRYAVTMWPTNNVTEQVIFNGKKWQVRLFRDGKSVMKFVGISEIVTAPVGVYYWPVRLLRSEAGAITP